MIKPRSYMWVIFLLTLGLAGCATAPMQEMSDARQALQAARDADAGAFVPKRYSEAEQRLLRAEKRLSSRDYKSARDNALTARREAIAARNMALAISQAKQVLVEVAAEKVLSQEARDWVTQAEAAAAAGDEETTMNTAARAKKRALEDLRRVREARRREQQENRLWLEQATPLLDQARNEKPRMNDEQRRALAEAVAVYEAQQGKAAFDGLSAVLAELPEHTAILPPAPPAAKEYRVMRGDTLWSIAAKPEVYGNPRWWPLIYRANHAQITDVDVLRAGQILKIDNQPSEEAISHAVRHAAQREKWSAGVAEKEDRLYLRDSR